MPTILESSPTPQSFCAFDETQESEQVEWWYKVFVAICIKNSTWLLVEVCV